VRPMANTGENPIHSHGFAQEGRGPRSGCRSPCRTLPEQASAASGFFGSAWLGRNAPSSAAEL